MCHSPVRVTSGEALAQVLFWVYDQKGTQVDSMMDEIIETKEKARITRSTTNHIRIKLLENFEMFRAQARVRALKQDGRSSNVCQSCHFYCYCY